MAMVAGAIANGGVLMRPTLVDRIVGPGGRTITATKPQSGYEDAEKILIDDLSVERDRCEHDARSAAGI